MLYLEFVYLGAKISFFHEMNKKILEVTNKIEIMEYK